MTINDIVGSKFERFQLFDTIMIPKTQADGKGRKFGTNPAGWPCLYATVVSGPTATDSFHFAKPIGANCPVEVDETFHPINFAESSKFRMSEVK